MEELMKSGWVETVERLAAAAEKLEQAVERMAAETRVERIEAEASAVSVLEQRLAEAEAKLASLVEGKGSSLAAAGSARKTVPAVMAAKGVGEVGALEAGALDAALGSLSVEQRIAVKAELMRAGVL